MQTSVGSLGFIGLGNMGGHMARNLLKKGYKLVIYDVSKDAVNDLKNTPDCESCMCFMLLYHYDMPKAIIKKNPRFTSNFSKKIFFEGSGEGVDKFIFLLLI